MMRMRLPIDVALNDMPLTQAFAFRSWDAENNPWMALDRKTDGYIAQERWRKSEVANG